MKKLRDFLNRYVPSYLWPCAAAYLAALLLTYYGTRVINAGRTMYDLSLPVDRVIPLYAPAVVIYVLAYLQWAGIYLLAAFQDKDTCRRTIFASVFAKVITCLIFIAVPTSMAHLRPAITGTDPFSRLLAGIYAVDAPDNLFPSIHCLESWICFRTAFRVKRLPRGFHVFHGVFTVAVFASTLLTRQHLILDVPAGILTAEVGMLLSALLFSRKHRADKTNDPPTEKGALPHDTKESRAGESSVGAGQTGQL